MDMDWQKYIEIHLCSGVHTADWLKVIGRLFCVLLLSLLRIGRLVCVHVAKEWEMESNAILHHFRQHDWKNEFIKTFLNKYQKFTNLWNITLGKLNNFIRSFSIFVFSSLIHFDSMCSSFAFEKHQPIGNICKINMNVHHNQNALNSLDSFV